MSRSPLTNSVSSNRSPDRKALSQQLQDTQKECKHFKQLYQSTVKELNQQSQSFQYSQRQASSIKDTSIFGNDDLKVVLSKQQIHIEILLAEQKETNDLIESLYMKDQANIREIHILTRALQLKAEAHNQTADYLIDTALNLDVNLQQSELKTLLRAQVVGLSKHNKELERQVQDLKTVREFNNQELVTLETQRHTLQMEVTELTQSCKKFSEERSKLVLKLSAMQQQLVQQQTQVDFERIQLEKTNRELQTQIHRLEEHLADAQSILPLQQNVQQAEHFQAQIERQSSLQFETNQQMAWLKEYYEEEIYSLNEQHSLEAIKLQDKLRVSLQQINQLEQMMIRGGQSLSNRKSSPRCRQTD